jgi:hypothetical protein
VKFPLFLPALPLAMSLAVASAAGVQQLIDDAVGRGEKSVTLPAGEHRIDRGLRLEGLRDFVFDGGGASLVFTNLRDGGLAVTDCEGLVLRNFTVDFDPLPFTQATVESVDAQKGEITFDLHDGYPHLAPHYLGGRALVFSPSTLSWKTSTPDLYALEAKALNARRGVLRFPPEKKTTLASVAPGDYLALDFRNARGLRIERCRDVKVEGVTFWSVPSIAVICRFMDGENVFSYTITRGPLPVGAKVPRLLSTSADGLNYAYARRGPVVENCDFSFMGDDAVNLHGIAFYVARVDGNVVYLLRPYGQEAFASVVAPDDEVLGLAPDSFEVKGRSKVARFVLEDRPPEDFSALAARVWKSKAVKGGKLTVYRLELDEPLGVQAGDFLEIPAIAAPGYVIRDNHFHHHRGRGLRLMSSEGLVERNTLEDIKQAAITLGPEFTFFREAGWVRDVTVRDNTIRRVGFDPVMHLPQTYAPGAISLFHRGETPAAPRPQTRHESIRLTNNVIEETGGPAIHIAQSRDVQVAGNRISAANQAGKPGTGSVYGLSADKAIVVEHSADVTVTEETP